MTAKQKIFISVLLSIILLVIIGVYRPSPFYPEYKAKYFWVNKFESKHNFDVIVYGDSRTYRGVSPEIMLKNKGIIGFNYGYTSAGYSQSIFDFLNSKIDSTKKQIIILGVTPYSLTLSASKVKFFNQESTRKGFDKFQRLNLNDGLSFFDRIIMKEIFKPEDENVKQQFYDDGWVATTRLLIDTLSGLRSYNSIFENNQISDSIVDLLMFNISKWTSMGVKVYAFRPPTIISMVQLEKDKSGFDEGIFKDKLNEVGAEWLNIINGDYITYDGSHLQKGSAIKLSKKLGKLIFE